MKRLAVAFFLMLCITVPAMAGGWRYELGSDLPGHYYSVGSYLPGRGVPAGPYGQREIVLIDPLTVTWRTLAKLPLKPVTDFESASKLEWIDGGAGMNAWLERDGGAQVWTAWQKDGWKFRLTQTFPGWPWPLAGPMGMIALSEGRKNRKAGGFLIDWIIDRYERSTPVIPDAVIWDSVQWSDGLLLGCSLGSGQYLDEWAGRLVFVSGLEWRFVQIPAMAGVIRLATFEPWPGRIWLCTAWGEIYWTEDLENFTLWHRLDYGRQANAFLHNLDGLLIVVGARGKVWRYSHPDSPADLVANIKNTEFMSLSPVELPDNGWCLAGPLTMRGAQNSRPVVISMEDRYAKEKPH